MQPSATTCRGDPRGPLINPTVAPCHAASHPAPHSYSTAHPLNSPHHRADSHPRSPTSPCGIRQAHHAAAGPSVDRLSASLRIPVSYYWVRNRWFYVSRMIGTPVRPFPVLFAGRLRDPLMLARVYGELRGRCGAYRVLLRPRLGSGFPSSGV